MATGAPESVYERDWHPKDVQAVSRTATGEKIAIPGTQFVHVVDVFIRPTIVGVDNFFSTW